MDTTQFNESNAYIKARQRVKEIKDFYGNLTSYCLVIPFLIFINYQVSWGFQWFWFPLLGWGMGCSHSWIYGVWIWKNMGRKKDPRTYGTR